MPTKLLMSIGLLAAVAAFPIWAKKDLTIKFSGYDWTIKDSHGSRVGPGPNFFNTDKKNVWVDKMGMLHLKITKVKNRLNCAEVVSEKSFGYGRYSFEVQQVLNLQPSVVFGLFTWDNTSSDYSNREIDFEYGLWGNPQSANFQNVVQPYTEKDRIFRYSVPLTKMRHVFVWKKDSIDFESWDLSTTSPSLISTWQFKGSNIPKPGREQVRLNLWLFLGKLDSKSEEMPEVIISNFTFTK